jgi:hypothetical protein
MKTKLLITISFLTISLNVFSAEVGQDENSPCTATHQLPSLAAKQMIEHNTEAEQLEKEVKSIGGVSI